MPSLSLTRVCVSNSEPALQAHVVEPKWAKIQQIHMKQEKENLCPKDTNYATFSLNRQV